MNASESQDSRPSDRTDQFLRLLGVHEQRTKAFIFSMVPRWADADDIAQEVRLKLWQQFDQYDPSKDFGAWARTIAHYHVLAYRKKSQRQHAQLSPEMIERVAETFDAGAERLEARSRWLHKCLQKLTEAKRRLLLQCYSGSQTIRQIAQGLGRSFDAVRKSVLRSRQQLAKCVDEEMRREDGP